jgi:hypothetical protein
MPEDQAAQRSAARFDRPARPAPPWPILPPPPPSLVTMVDELARDHDVRCDEVLDAVKAAFDEGAASVFVGRCRR